MNFLLFLSVLASAVWKPVATPRGFRCWPESDSTRFIKTWSNARDTFVVCAYDRLPDGPDYKLESLFEVQATLGGKPVRLARESEVGVKPVEAHIRGDSIFLTTSLYENQPYFERTIACASGVCRLSPPKCLLKAAVSAVPEATALDKQLSALTGEKRRKLWESYFEMGANINTGRRIVIAAMLGNAVARKVVELDVGTDAGGGESQSLYKDQIKEAAQYCPTRH